MDLANALLKKRFVSSTTCGLGRWRDESSIILSRWRPGRLVEKDGEWFMVTGYEKITERPATCDSLLLRLHLINLLAMFSQVITCLWPSEHLAISEFNWLTEAIDNRVSRLWQRALDFGRLLAVQLERWHKLSFICGINTGMMGESKEVMHPFGLRGAR